MKFLNNLDVQGYITQSNAQNTMLKADASGKLVPAIAGVDYLLSAGGGSANKIQHEVKLGEAMSIGTPVYIPITQDSGTNMVVMKASNSSESTSSKTLGLLAGSGVTGDFVDVVTEGLLEGLNTSTASKGDPVWLGSDGTLIFGLANKPTAPNHLVFIGVVTRSNANNGEIFVKVQNGFETDELHDVIANGRTANQVMYWDGSINRYASISSVLGYTPYNATNPNGYISGITGTMVTNALGYTPYNSSNPSGYITSASLTWANISGRPTALSQFTNDSGFITSSSLSGYVPYGNLTNSFGLNDYRLYLRTNGDVNHYIWNADDDWEEIVAYSGTGLRIKASNGAILGTFNTSNFTTPLVGEFGADSGDNKGISIKYGSNGYGRIRFYQNGTNHSTIHSFGNDAYSPSNGRINIDGQNGANIGAWNDPDFIVNKGGQTYARGYRGIGNVAGTGEATFHPAGIYSTGTQWLYGTLYRNGQTTSGQGWMYLDWNYGHSVVGVYSSVRYQGVWSMGDAYRLSADGTSTGNLYGLAWSHPNAGGQAGYLTNHGLIHMMYGTAFATISDNIWCRNNITAYSDIRVKENIEVIPNAMEKINAIRGVTFTRNDVPDKSKRHVGVIAQEIEKVLPEVITKNESNGHLSVAYGNITALTIEGLKEHDVTIKQQQRTINLLLEQVKYLNEVINGFTK